MNEYDDFYYDDGRFSDDGYDDSTDEYDIPTYDELDIEGRYYTYGSREDYNIWRNAQIEELKKARNRPVKIKGNTASKKLRKCNNRYSESEIQNRTNIVVTVIFPLFIIAVLVLFAISVYLIG